MAALRRFIPSFTNSSKTGTLTALKQQTTSKATKALKVIAAGACVTAAAGAAYYGCSLVGRRSGLKSHVEARLLHLALPSVSATDKVQWRVLSRFSDNSRPTCSLTETPVVVQKASISFLVFLT